MEFTLNGFVIEGNTRIGKYSKFNLYRLVEVKEGKKAGTFVRDACWYDATLEKCLQEIARLTMASAEEIDSIESYIKTYKEMSENLGSQIREFNDKVIKEIING